MKRLLLAALLTLAMPALAQVIPSVTQGNTRRVEFPGYTTGGAVQLFDISGNVIGTSTNPIYMICTSGCSGGGGGGGGTSSNFGSAFPTAGTAAGFRNGGGNMDYALVDASHFLDVNVQTSALPTGAALDASLQSILTKLNASVAVTGTFWQATQPVSIATAPVLVPGSAIIGKVGIDQTTPGVTNGVQINAALPAGANLLGKTGIDQTTDGTTNAVHLVAGTAISGKFGIDQTTDGTTNGVHLTAGTNLAGKFGIDQTTPGTTNGVSLAQIGSTAVDANSGNKSAGTQRIVIATDQPPLTNPLLVTPKGVQDSGGTDMTDTALHALGVKQVLGTANGCTGFHLLSAATNNSTNVKNAAGVLCEVVVINYGAAVGQDLRFYNTSSAPTCSSATGLVWNFPIPTNATAANGAGIVVPIPQGLNFPTGISYCLTGAVADNDNTSAATGVALNGSYN